MDTTVYDLKTQFEQAMSVASETLARGELVIFDTWSGGARVLRRDGKSISSPTWSNLLK